MGLMSKGRSLKVVFFSYLLSIGVGLMVAVGLALLSFITLYNIGLIVPANYTENLILEKRDTISNATTFDASLIPEDASYIFLTPDDKLKASNMTDSLAKKAQLFHNQEVVATPSESFIEIKRADGYVIINYSLEAHYTNAWMEKYFPKINVLFASLMIFFCFISTLIITFIWAKRITKQLGPILDASEKIANQKLDFEIGKSTIKEFNAVLNSLDKMKIALNDSLRENWQQEENKRNQISALTHDLKTPVAIVQGNAELLKETTLTKEQEIYLDFIVKNANRISDYSKTLMVMNGSNQLSDLNVKKVQSSVIVEKARELAKEIVSVDKHELSEVIDFEDKALMIDMRLFERALQNVLSNAVQYAPKQSLIELRILMTDNKLLLSVLNQGKGFSNEGLAHGLEQFYREDKSRHSSTNYGLGLYISSQIMTLHKGELLLQNKPDKKGAIVTLAFPLIE
ncbi:sensor histidine kinase [Streptococcus pacificus]|uniref:histidine kinase n=1 Tax=Streptococcus pacificus TaxID=2740577 RepID=A0ABS0ZJT2_9STRE|nr:HAMP domain-containing sensor histidine kinase [Streptococcus pacificus]MBJ8326204.1 HAMP domain-containing histidine kinase [Streptococcus pacificus]